MADAFTVKDMDLYYGSFHALKNVNLNIASGWNAWQQPS